jgi:hypothetical protein
MAVEKAPALANPRTRRIVIISGVVVLLIAVAWFARYQLVGGQRPGCDRGADTRHDNLDLP